ncbi:proteinase-activated receptor 1-like [Kryptolebias marmoratus]|uniref:Proteinase-activated receptor 1 n=1 Tax=Kryptolebias marmoratus TaxID=37003 RepID=A0A3Q3AI14_KRYMA|nr:proteinase-activated receptor 1-like [Kryptolebias marmoratus]
MKFVTCRMLPLDVKCIFLVLMWSCSPAAAQTKGHPRATGKPRTFVGFSLTDPDELIDPNLIWGYGELKQNDSIRIRMHNNTNSGIEVSEEARMFLTGPVSTILMPSFYTLVCCISVPINLCAVLAFARGIRPKKPAAIYMLNLAFADLLFGLMLPFKISYHFEGNNWIFGPLMCCVVTAGFYWNMYCSVLLIACISVDRLLAVVYPINSLAWRRPQNAIIACATMWIVSCIGSVPLVLSNQTVELSNLNITTCHDVQVSGNIFWLKIYFIAISCALFFLPLLVTVVSYTNVIWTLSSMSHGVPGSSRRRRRAVVMTFTVLVIFLLCFMPTNCVLLAHYLLFTEGFEKNKETPDGTYGLYLMFLCLGSLNCLLDPLAYYFGSSQCQRQLSNVLTCQKTADRRRIAHSSSDSCRSSTRAILKSSRTKSSKINSSVAEMDSCQTMLNSQYKKLMI